jgi:UDP-glucose 4-epimerase
MTKLFLENILKCYDKAYGLRSVGLRYFNAAGADPDGEIGEEHEPETHLIPLVIAAAQGRSPAVEIFGSDYDTPDGTAVRDYIHVTDLANAHVRALQYLLAGGNSTRTNLGTGHGYSVREVISAVEAGTGSAVPVLNRARRAGDPPRLVADPRHAHTLLGWKPIVSDLKTIVRTAWSWHDKRNLSAHPGKDNSGLRAVRASAHRHTV